MQINKNALTEIYIVEQNKLRIKIGMCACKLQMSGSQYLNAGASTNL